MFNPYTVADVVGHSKKGMALPLTAENYSEPSTLKSRIECVESIVIVNEMLTQNYIKRNMV